MAITPIEIKTSTDMKNPNEFNFKCRFHLGEGKHFMHWRIEDMKTGVVEFHNPNEVCFQFKGAFLRNQLGAAKKINGGANKTVCAWVECQEVEIYALMDSITKLDADKTVCTWIECQGVEIYALMDSIAKLDKKVCYNPRTSPHWLLGDHIVDGESFDLLVTSGRGVYLPITLDDIFTSNEWVTIEKMSNDFDLA